jgi:ribosomal protein S18 acetylase RimI-like enzyme
MDTSGMLYQATRHDLSRVALFLDSAPFIHRHLDWRNTFEWLDSSPFLILSKNDTIQAILAAAPDPPGYAWVRCFAVGRGVSPSTAWEALSTAASSILTDLHAQMVAVSLQDWFSQVLRQHGFATKQKIVVLEWNHHQPSESLLPEDILIRPMVPGDINRVTEVDALSFEPLWVNSLTSLKAAYLQAEHTSVAEYQGQIIWYELSTASQFTAHLARLAVLPEFQKRSIGRQLVVEMLTFFGKRGVLQLTVNTQNTNQASLHLYESLGFHLTDENYPVFSL